MYDEYLAMLLVGEQQFARQYGHMLSHNIFEQEGGAPSNTAAHKGGTSPVAGGAFSSEEKLVLLTGGIHSYKFSKK